MSRVPRPLIPTSPLEPTSALEPALIFSHLMASAVRPPRQLAPTVGQLEVLAGDTFQTGPFIDSGERVDAVDPLAASFAALRIPDASAADEYPSGVLDVSDSPVPLGDSNSVGAADLYVRVEVFATGSGSATSSAANRAADARAAAERASTADPLRAAIQNLSNPFIADVNATDAAQTRAQLDEERKRLRDTAETLAAVQRRLESAQRERDAAYGLTPTAAEPSRIDEVRTRGAAIGRALGAAPPVYDTPVKNMRAAQAAAVGLEQLRGEELQERLQRMNELLGAANT